MEPGEKCYLKVRGHWTEFIFQRLHSEFGEACTVWNGNGDQTCLLSELLTQESYKAMMALKAEEERKKMEPRERERLAPVIEMWNAGHYTGKAMAAIKGGHHIGWTAKIMCAMRWGFIIKPPATAV